MLLHVVHGMLTETMDGITRRKFRRIDENVKMNDRIGKVEYKKWIGVKSNSIRVHFIPLDKTREIQLRWYTVVFRTEKRKKKTGVDGIEDDMSRSCCE